MSAPVVTAPVVIAIDGPAAAGKGTLARRLAAELGLPYLDTGLLYRAVGRRVLDAGADPADPAAAEAAVRALTPADLGRADLRGPAADAAASRVATHPGVRAALVAFQRSFGSERGAVLDGRDIGTAIFPEAPVKLFVTAALETRAHRRWLEQQARAPGAEGAQPGADGAQPGAERAKVEAEMRARDAQDAGRAAAPLHPAWDAVILDTTALDPEAAFRAALSLVRARLG